MLPFGVLEQMPQLLSRAGHANWQQGYENVKKDILLIEEDIKN
ncbi:MAG: hypothetical protein ABJL44_01840 [Algibacter sp.]